MQTKQRYYGKAVASFLLVLLMMPLGHALMIIMEHTMSEQAMHRAAFAMGAAGLVAVIAGIFAKGDTRQTLWGLFGGMMFWTGWVEFLFMYFANRFGTQPMLDPHTGEVVTRPEYLIMPASFGFWMLIMVLYVFRYNTGCNFIRWWQRLLPAAVRDKAQARPMARHSSLVTFAELVMIMWGSYLLLMFCYDPEFVGDSHPLTFVVGTCCLAGAVYVFRLMAHTSSTGASIRLAIPAVILFWTPVEILGRLDFFREIWIEPARYKAPMSAILTTFIVLALYLWFRRIDRRNQRA